VQSVVQLSALVSPQNYLKITGTQRKNITDLENNSTVLLTAFYHVVYHV